MVAASSAILLRSAISELDPQIECSARHDFTEQIVFR